MNCLKQLQKKIVSKLLSYILCPKDRLIFLKKDSRRVTNFNLVVQPLNGRAIAMGLFSEYILRVFG